MGQFADTYKDYHISLSSGMFSFWPPWVKSLALGDLKKKFI